jgi:hypothetical protein
MKTEDRTFRTKKRLETAKDAFAAGGHLILSGGGHSLRLPIATWCALSLVALEETEKALLSNTRFAVCWEL